MNLIKYSLKEHWMIFLSKISFLKTRNLSLACAKDAVGSAVIRICVPLGSSGEEGTLWRTRRQGPVLDGAAFAFKIPFHPPPLNSLCSQFCSAAFIEVRHHRGVPRGSSVFCCPLWSGLAAILFSPACLLRLWSSQGPWRSTLQQTILL